MFEEVADAFIGGRFIAVQSKKRFEEAYLTSTIAWMTEKSIFPA